MGENLRAEIFKAHLVMYIGFMKACSNGLSNDGNYFKGRNFHGDKLSRTPMMIIKFRGYKLSQKWQILVKFSYFDAIFSDFSSNISRTPMKVRFRGYKLSRTSKKLAKSRKFLPAKLSTFKVS